MSVRIQEENNCELTMDICPYFDLFAGDVLVI